MVLAQESVRRSLDVARLPQRRTNGKSLLGTLLAPLLPAFLGNTTLPSHHPWGDLNLGTDYYHHPPHTGIVRHYDFTISRGVIAPDGVERDSLLVNGAFPGPMIEANWGDTIEVTVHNNITGPEEGTALHWHGFLQHGTPYEDGAPAISQCPIAPGRTYTYRFMAQLYGTTWYHSHYSSQYAGGLVGPVVIYGPAPKCDIDLGPVMLSDHYHKDYFTLVEETMKPNSAPFVSNNTLINGKGNFDCSKLQPGNNNGSSNGNGTSTSTPTFGNGTLPRCDSNAGLSKFRFRRGRTHRLRLINSGAEALQRFSIDGHKMSVISNDFVPMTPYETEVVTLGIGQRTEVIVLANDPQHLGAYWMRTNVSTPCSLSAQPFGLAAIYYDDVDENSTPKSTPWNVPDPGTCANDDLATTDPVMKLKPPVPDLTYEMNVTLGKNASNITLWSLGGPSFRGNYNSPTLLLSKLGNYTFEEEWNVKNTHNARSVRVIVNNTTPVAHPMHLHGFNMYVLAEGVGQWDGKVVRPENPERRDVIQMRKNGYIVIQFDAGENPGVWPFHCHIAWHASAGLFTQFITAGDRLRALPFPRPVAETCREWAQYTHTDIPLQIDSGL